MATRELHHCDNATALLAYVGAERQAEARATARQLAAAVAWAGMHSTDSLDEAAVLVAGAEEALTIAGPGCPAGRRVQCVGVRRRPRAFLRRGADVSG